MIRKSRQLSLPGFELSDYLAESLAFLQKHEPQEGFFVGFSGGKDSIVTLELCRMAGVKYQSYFTQTTIDPPEILRFIRTYYHEVKWLRPAKSFFACVPKNAPPLRTQRWCCEYLKEQPSFDVLLNHRIFGIRAEESRSRAQRGRINPHRIPGGRIIFGYHPIFTWPEWAVWEFIEKHQLPYPSLYDEGFTRIGCIICPYSVLGSGTTQKKRRAISMARWPGIWKAFRHAVYRYWQRKRADDSTTHEAYVNERFYEYWHAYLQHFER